jgi:hypothetical protein
MKVMVLVTLALATVLVPATQGFGLGSATAAQVAQSGSGCRNTQLTVRYQSSNGAAGHIGIIYRIHNQSNQPCTLYGYPGVQLLDRHFLSLPTHVHRGGGMIVGSIPKQLVQVSAHGNAYFALDYSDVPVNNQPCETAKYVMVFAPNDVLPVVTYAFGSGGITTCTGNLDVTPVTSRPRFR